jgi:biopolymer transport protein ExbD
MKKLIILGIFILTAGLVNAQTQTTKVNQRQGNQKDRITDGVKSGKLTKKETKNLFLQQRDIKRTKKVAKADGVVTRKERVVIHSKQNSANRNIKRKKKNDRSRR